MVIIMTTMMIATMMMMMMLGRGSVIRTITPHMMAVRPTFDGKTYHGGNTKQRKRLFSPCRKKGTSFLWALFKQMRFIQNHFYIMFLPSLLVTYILRFRFNLGFNNRGDVQSLNTTGNCGFTIVKLDPKLLRYFSLFLFFSLSSFLTNLILHGRSNKLATVPRPMFARYQDQFE